MKQNNYFVIETSAQSILGSAEQDLHFPGQLRLQAYSHLASGANMIAYWPWHSIHNSLESFWKGLLSHDLKPNPTYYEAKRIASEFTSIGSKTLSLKKQNKVAVYFSNESLTAIKLFPFSYKLNYNDILRRIYEVLYKANIECDFIDHTVEDISKYKVIVVPPLLLKDNPFDVYEKDNYVTTWAELLIPETAKVLGWYSHPYWGKYAAVTTNKYGERNVTYFGTLPSNAILKKIILDVCDKEQVRVVNSTIEFPIIVRHGKTIWEIISIIILTIRLLKNLLNINIKMG